ncbi:MAG: hypothetical protein AAF212_04115 [Verrucomicrobiota bacterium]
MDSPTAPEIESSAENTESSETPTLLFVQNAAGMTFEESTLTLINAEKMLTYFSDRPFRIAGEVTREEMSDLVTESFENSAPNAALVILTDAGVHDCVVTLTEAPTLSGDNVVIPGIEVIHGEVPSEGGVCSLFIDTVAFRRPPPPPPPPPPHPRPRPRPRF